jgi:uncharacterized membrane protein YgcG
MPRRLECSSNQRRAKRFRAVVFSTAAVVLITMAVLAVVRAHHPRLHTLPQKVFHLKDGRFCYKQRDTTNNSDTWYWLCNSATGNYYTSGTSLGDRMPGRSAWMSSRAQPNLEARPNPQEEDQIAGEDAGKTPGAEEELVAENDSGEPASAEEGGAGASSGDSSGGSSDSAGGDDGGGGGGGED